MSDLIKRLGELEDKSQHCRSAHLLAVEVMREITNPLEALSNLTFLTLEEAQDSDRVRKYMLIAEEHVATIGRIASHTLGLVSYGSSADSVDSANMIHLLDSAIGFHKRAATTKKIHLVRDAPTELTARLNGPNILLALSSLIVNALDALPDAGTLSIRLRKRSDGIHLLVADNGHGIAPEHAGRIYEPFFSTRTGAGKGLGLSFTRKIVEDHGGRIRFRSSVRAGRNGTAFKMFFPLQLPEPA